VQAVPSLEVLDCRTILLERPAASNRCSRFAASKGFDFDRGKSARSLDAEDLVLRSAWDRRAQVIEDLFGAGGGLSGRVGREDRVRNAAGATKSKPGPQFLMPSRTAFGV